MTANGLLTRASGAKKVDMRPTELMASKSGDVDFNPAADAFALRLRADFVGPNRYRIGQPGPDKGSILLDANGSCRDEGGECSECGSVDGEYRFFVRVEDLNTKPWESVYACCTRCCTPEEIAIVNGGNR